eukprot:GEMP01053663.1.p1 GENE.GEMP01053663.1~~GEMP01053663.1.p1  ORF type:complete len:311 (+),score=91.45 GEMP01053663.1:120-1052(+)
MGADVLLAALREEALDDKRRFELARASGALSVGSSSGSSRSVAARQRKWELPHDPVVATSLRAAWERMQTRQCRNSIAALALEFLLRNDMADLREGDFTNDVAHQCLDDASRGSTYTIDGEYVAAESLAEVLTKCIPSGAARRCISSWLSQGGFALLDRASVLAKMPVVIPGECTQTTDYMLKRVRDKAWLFQMCCTKERFSFVVIDDRPLRLVNPDNVLLLKSCSVMVRDAEDGTVVIEVEDVQDKRLLGREIPNAMEIESAFVLPLPATASSTAKPRSRRWYSGAFCRHRLTHLRSSASRILRRSQSR